MSQVIYSKSNSYRRPEYRIGTRIVNDAGNLYVEKYALCPQAVSHINTIKDNYHKIRDLYKNVTVLPFEEISEGVLRFPYIEGESLTRNIDFDSDPPEVIKEKVEKILDVILDFKKEYVVPFEMTKGFERMFPGCEPNPGEPAVKIANIDGIVQNFIKSEEGIHLFDYEWILDFPVPVSFIKYRIYYAILPYERLIEYLYKGEKEYFCCLANITDKEEEKYRKMENIFQEHANGLEYEKNFLRNYNKEKRELKFLLEDNDLIKEKDKEIQKLKEALKEKNEKIASVKRGIRNPFYGIKLFVTYINKKIKE